MIIITFCFFLGQLLRAICAFLDLSVLLDMTCFFDVILVEVGFNSLVLSCDHYVQLHCTAFVDVMSWRVVFFVDGFEGFLGATIAILLDNLKRFERRCVIFLGTFLWYRITNIRQLLKGHHLIWLLSIVVCSLRHLQVYLFYSSSRCIELSPSLLKFTLGGHPFFAHIMECPVSSRWGRI